MTDTAASQLVAGKYEIVKKLGEGGMGAVYEAVHRRIGRRVAIKFLHPAFAADPEIVARFEREAQAAGATGNPHIVQITDLGETEQGAVYLVLEYLDGRELSAEVARGPLSIGRAVRIARQICDGLGEVHARGIVHRDLKPSNVFLVEHLGDPDFVKILDFGVAKFTRPEGEAPGPKTRTGAPIGTPAYMSPEQASGQKNVDPRTDVYAIGVILFECLTGRTPFDSESFAHLLMRIMFDPAPKVGAVRPDVPPALEAVIERALTKQPENRFESCAALAEALAPFAALDAAPPAVEHLGSMPKPTPISEIRRSGSSPISGVEQTVASTPPPSPSPTPIAASPVARPRTGLIAGVGAVVVAALIGVTWMVTRGSGETEGTAPSAGPPAAPLEVSIEAHPAGAALAIDGRPADNPFRGALEGGTHVLEARADGHETLRVERSIEPGERVRLDLRPAPAPVAAEPVAMEPRAAPAVADAPPPAAAEGRSPRAHTGARPAPANESAPPREPAPVVREAPPREAASTREPAAPASPTPAGPRPVDQRAPVGDIF